MPGPLLQTKLIVPQQRPSLVSRGRLIEKLQRGLMGKLTLISAPAGYGKTTLAVDLLAQLRNMDAAWISIDEEDNDPARFLTYLVAALQSLRPGMAEEVTAVLQSPQPPPMEVVLTPLLNELTVVKERLLLILDDYHLIETQAIHQMLAFLLGHQPASLHLIIVTRADPLLPLARLRARSELTEIRQDDLRFTIDEATRFLNQIMQLGLRPEQVRTLQQQTEGWIAGLQLAALSMQGKDDADAFLASFSGSFRFILDYLVDEVLGQRPQGTRDFLLKTSILERLNGSLCNSVTGQTGGQRILEQLDQANLFIFPLDESRQWFRYHRLFAELLRQRLRAFDEVSIASLHRQASQWYENNGYPAEAIHHALEGQDWARAAALIGPAADDMLKQGQIVTVIAWFERLPEVIVHSQPALGLVFSWALLLVGQFDRAEGLLSTSAALAQENSTLLGQILAAQAFLARSRGDNAGVITKSEQALQLLPENDFVSRGTVSMNLGLVYWHEGRLSEAEEALVAGRDIGRKIGNRYGELTCRIFLARTLAAKGQLREAKSMTQHIVAEGGRIPILALAHYDLGALHYEWNELDLAHEQVNQGMALSQKSGNVEFLNAGHIQQALLLLAMGDAQGARREAENSWTLSRDLNPATQARSTAVQVEVALALGDLDQAFSLAEGLSSEVDAHSFYRFLGLTQIKLLIALGKKGAAARELEICHQKATRAGWSYGLVATRVLQALASPTVEAGQQVLIEALRLAEPQGYIRTFADGGKPLARLLQDLATTGIQAAYAREILAAIGENGRPKVDRAPLRQQLVEPLSERELEILQLLAERQSNSEIALALNVSVNTIKTHLQHIYEKLGVHNRKMAVAKAQELFLL